MKYAIATIFPYEDDKIEKREQNWRWNENPAEEN